MGSVIAAGWCRSVVGDDEAVTKVVTKVVTKAVTRTLS
jgi:hypothetical protein